LRDKIGEFEKRGAQIVAVDPHESHRVRHMLRSVVYRAEELTYPILADPGHTVSATYSVAFHMNIHTEWSNRPVTFILDKEGVIRYERRGKMFSDRPKPEELLQELDRLSRTAKVFSQDRLQPEVLGVYPCGV
jgi:peroxiredoxin